MKKVLLGVFLVVMIVALIFVGIKLSKPQTNEINNTNTENNKKTSKKFNELTMTRRIGSFDDVWVDLPNWREDGSETCTVAENMNYYIISVISEEDYSLDELFNNVAKADLKHFVERATYEDFVPQKSGEVTLSNGIKATKFEGTLHLDNYGTPYQYPTYGYYFKFNKYPIMIMSVETDTESVNNSEEQRLATNKYVDEIVQTIRNTEN